jgi:cell cycle sensor histidine kinase DivJ
MRSLGARLLAWMNATEDRAETSRSVTLRRQAILASTRAGMLALILGSPIAVIGLMQGQLLAPLIGLLGIVVTAFAERAARSDRLEWAGGGLVLCTITLGALLSVADPQSIDLGVAIILLGPVQAALLLPRSAGAVVWSAFAAGVLITAASSAGMMHWPEPFLLLDQAIALLCFVITVLLTVQMARRLASVLDQQERGRLDALSVVIEQIQEAVFRIGPDGKLQFATRAAEPLLGCRRFELAGDGLFERVHVLDRPLYLTSLAAATRDHDSRWVEIRLRRDQPDMPGAAPQFFWAGMLFTPVVPADLTDQPAEVMAMVHDVTERREREAELQRARKAAEEASAAKTRFLATMGHELRTPLNAIVGFSEMMTSGVVGELPPAHREYARLIHQSGMHLLDVVKMMLDMSRIEAGKFELVTEPFAPDLLVEPCLKIVDGMAREKSVRLMTELPRQMPMLVADERACRQIVINLLTNAIKFSHAHSVVTLAMRRQGRHLAIVVTDKGIGMGEDALAHVGEPFFQAQDTLSRRYEGTGLGLSIVKGLVELHQGSLHAASVAGEGTVMTVLLPINGPETKVVETAEVTHLRRDPVHQTMATWHADERRKAQ